MRMLVSHFTLARGISVEAFETAWESFRTALIGSGLAREASGLLHRQPESGYDTDEERGQAFLTTITFLDQAAADEAWRLMEEGSSDLAKRHVAVIRKTREAIFTFWNDDGPSRV